MRNVLKHIKRKNHTMDNYSIGLANMTIELGVGNGASAALGFKESGHRPSGEVKSTQEAPIETPPAPHFIGLAT